jgi:hypothetical protein
MVMDPTMAELDCIEAPRRIVAKGQERVKGDIGEIILLAVHLHRLPRRRMRAGA